jgi:prevent-host-death family protein
MANTEIRTCAAGDARDHFSEVINQAAYGSKRIVLTRHGKNLAAVVPMSDFELLNELERLIDVEEARKVLAAAKKEGVKPLEDLMEELGL